MLSVEPLVEPLAEVLLSFFCVSVEEAALELDDGALELVEPPAALSFLVASAADDALDEDDGGVALPDIELEVELSLFFDASTLTEAEPEGAAGVVVVLDDEEEPVAPDGVVVVLETARSPSRSQPVSMPAPSARETATAKVVSLICYVLRGLGIR